MIRLVFERLGLQSELDGDDVLVPGGQKLVVAARRRRATRCKVQDGPWPAFPADLTSIAVALATQCEGAVLVHEWMFENRLVFTDKLVLDGRRHHRSATRTARSSPARAGCAASALESPGHPRRHGDADRRAVRRGPHARSATSARSTAATSASTSACASSARGSSASASEPVARLALRARGRPMIHPIPSGTRDVLPDEMRELRAITDALRGVFERARLRRGLHARARVRGGAAPRRRRRAARLPRLRRPRRRARRCART